MNNFDDVLATIVMKPEEPEKDKYIEHPIIFDPSNPDKPITTPILSRINVEMMHDANKQFMKNRNDFDERLSKPILSDLSTDQFIIIKNTLINNIIESTLMSFDNYWEYAKRNILCNVLQFKTEEAGFQDFSCSYIFNKNLHESMSDIEGFICGYLGIYKNISERTISNEIDNMFDTANNMVTYTEKKAINLSQYIMSIIVKSIHEALYQYLSNFRVVNIIENSNALKMLNEDGSNMKTTIEQVVGYTLYNSLYNFTATCLYPSIYNILSNAQVSIYTLYNDLYVANKNNDKNNNDIL